MRFARPSSCISLHAAPARVCGLTADHRLHRIACQCRASSNSSQATNVSETHNSGAASSSCSSPSKFSWTFDNPSRPDSSSEFPQANSRVRIMEVPIASIRRPLGKTRSNNQEKVAALMTSIQEIGLQEPIDVLEVDGQIYGFSGCHRFEAHKNLGLETIRCRVRKATQSVLKMHLM